MTWAIPADTCLPPENFRKRLPVAALVVLLHIVFLAALQLHQVVTSVSSATEMILTLPPLPREDITPALIEAAPAPQRSFGTFTPPPDFSPAQPDLSALGFLLFSCNIDTLRTLSREDQARCRAAGQGIGPPSPDVMAQITDRSKLVTNASRYEDEIVARNTPFHVPCTYVSIPEDGATPAIMANPICVIGEFYKALK